MRNLLLFFFRCRPWLLLAAYIIISCVLLFSSNPYQQSVYLTSANSVSSTLYSGATKVKSYFNLFEVNEDLLRRNNLLEKKVLELEARIQLYQEKEIALELPADSSLSRFDFIVAHVINNSINRAHNFITINTGSA
ncbi:MAG: rod shape-determining protein MreC, partial [Paramuribaculum sp.]|nr:rod shape-determining protein MreC [Paramuribaculum sp.]